MGCAGSVPAEDVRIQTNASSQSRRSDEPSKPPLRNYHSDISNESSALVGRLAKQGSVKDFQRNRPFRRPNGHGACGSGGCAAKGHGRDVRHEDDLAGLDGNRRQELSVEVEIQKKLDHPNICKIIESFEDPRRILYIVMELCTGGSLVSAFVPITGFNERAAATLVEKMLSAIICRRTAWCTATSSWTT